MPITKNAFITTGANLLASSSDSAKLDAQVLLLNILQKPRSYLFTWPEKQLTMSNHKRLSVHVSVV
ncbi:hypothetical protein [Pseudoalteromonas sp. M58]|uniref:hypothetical protein n=1 Tax=Pseudoalteromonas sp. M58 TaxID=3141534 RepID=UPI00366E72CC